MQKVKQFALEKKVVFIRAAAIVLALVLMVLLSQTAFAETTYVITDGNRVVIHTSSATDPEAVLDEAGLELSADDTYTIAGTSGITVRRGQNVTIDYYGEVIEAVALGETVEELLTRLNLTWSKSDTVSLPLDTVTYDGMELSVAKVIRQEQTYTASIPYDTIYCTDDTLPVGTEVVLTAGEAGEMVCTANVTYVNGIESDRSVSSEKVIQQATDQVIAVGSYDPTQEEPAEDDLPVLPVIGDGTITLATGEVLTYTRTMQSVATAYNCEGYIGTTATGTRARVGAIAVDPRVIPYGTRMYIVSNDGQYVYGFATAEDCGDKRFIHDSRVDLYYDTLYECVQFGARECTIYFLG